MIAPTDPDPDWRVPFSFTRRFWVGCAGLLLSVSFVVITILTAMDARALSRNGIPLQATVIDARETGTTDTKFDLTYQFTFADQILNLERDVPEAFFRTHPAGTIWPIRVHNGDPSIHDLFANETRNRALGFLAFTIFMVLFGASFALSGGNLRTLRNRLATKPS